MKKTGVNILKIIIQIFFLYLLTLVGDVVVHFLHLPLPGSIIGLIILLVLLHMKIVPKAFIAKGAGFLLPLLTLLFIPATVGVINHPELLSWYGVTLLFITIVSTIFTMIFTAKIAQKLEAAELKEREGEKL